MSCVATPDWFIGINIDKLRERDDEVMRNKNQKTSASAWVVSMIIKQHTIGFRFMK